MQFAFYQIQKLSIAKVLALAMIASAKSPAFTGKLKQILSISSSSFGEHKVYIIICPQRPSAQ